MRPLLTFQLKLLYHKILHAVTNRPPRTNNTLTLPAGIRLSSASFPSNGEPLDLIYLVDSSCILFIKSFKSSVISDSGTSLIEPIIGIFRFCISVKFIVISANAKQ